MARKINVVEARKSGSLSDIFKKLGKYKFIYTASVKNMFQKLKTW